MAANGFICKEELSNDNNNTVLIHDEKTYWAYYDHPSPFTPNVVYRRWVSTPALLVSFEDQTLYKGLSHDGFIVWPEWISYDNGQTWTITESYHSIML